MMGIESGPYFLACDDKNQNSRFGCTSIRRVMMKTQNWLISSSNLFGLISKILKIHLDHGTVLARCSCALVGMFCKVCVADSVAWTWELECDKNRLIFPV
jgi:hypothetical protein